MAKRSPVAVDVAAAIADMPTLELQRRAFSELVDSSKRLQGVAFTAALHLNAHVATELQERGIAIWSETGVRL